MQELLTQELIAKADQAIFEAQCLRRQGRLLRIEASVRASELGKTIVERHMKSDSLRETEM